MAFLAPAAAGAVSATAGASALAGAAGASSALGAGLTAGTALGSGAAMAAMLALSYAGANLAAPGILGALPSAVAPTAGIFAKAAPALGGLKSLTPAIAQAPGAAGFKSLAMANAPLTANPASWNAVNQAAGLGNVGGQAGNLGAQFTNVADVAAKTNANTGLLGQGANFKAAPSMTKTAGTVTERLAPVFAGAYQKNRPTHPADCLLLPVADRTSPALTDMREQY